MSRLLVAALLLAAVMPAAASDYDDGMAARRRGDYDAALAIFTRMLQKDPNSGGALEGLSLVALGQHRWQDALDLLDHWEKIDGDSGYIEGLRARALAPLHRNRELVDALVREGNFELYDLRPLERADDLLRSQESGVFPKARIYKTISEEELETPSPQRIVYSGRSIGADARQMISVSSDGAHALAAIGGASVREEAQLNDTGNFTYYDLLEQVYSMGLEGRRPGYSWSGQYGQSLLSDIHGEGVGRVPFSRANLYGEADLGDLTLRGWGQRAPYFLRGAGGTDYFALLREDSARAEAEAYRWGWGFLGRAGVWDYSTHTTVNSESVTAIKEIGETGLFSPHVGRSYEEFSGAGTNGALAVMPYNDVGVRTRLGGTDVWSAGASYDYWQYRDGNRANWVDGDARLWAPKKFHDFSVIYRFHLEDYLYPDPSYRSTDYRTHWAGPVWRHRWGGGPLWTQLSYERGWCFDATRGYYTAYNWVGSLEWYRGRTFSLVTQGNAGTDTVHDQTYSASLTGRWTF